MNVHYNYHEGIHIRILAFDLMMHFHITIDTRINIKLNKTYI